MTMTREDYIALFPSLEAAINFENTVLSSSASEYWDFLASQWRQRERETARTDSENSSEEVDSNYLISTRELNLTRTQRLQLRAEEYKLAADTLGRMAESVLDCQVRAKLSQLAKELEASALLWGEISVDSRNWKP